MINPDDAKTFISDLLAGEQVKLLGDAPWLQNSKLPFDEQGKLTIEIVDKADIDTLQPRGDRLIYQLESSPEITGKLAIIGTGPGSHDLSLIHI